MSRIRTVLLAASAAVLCAAPSALAAPPDWSPSALLTPGSFPRTEAGPDGTIAVAYISPLGSLQVRTRRPGQPLGDPRLVAGIHEGPDNFEMAVGPQGQVAFTWRGPENATRSRTLGADGVMTDITDVAPAAEGGANQQVDFTADGSVVYVWKKFAPNAVRMRIRGPGGLLGPVQTISAAGEEGNDPKFAVAPDGDIVFVYEFGDDIVLRERNANGTLDAQQLLTATGDNVDVDVAPNGDATAVWNDNAITVRRRLANGTLEAAPVEIDGGDLPQNLVVEVADDGTAFIAWADEDSGEDTKRIRLRSRTAGNALSSIQTLSDPAATKTRLDPRIAVSPTGSLLATWRTIDSTAVEARAVLPGRPPSRIATLFAGNDSAGFDTAVTASGDGIAVAGGDGDVRRAAFDVAAPAAGAVTAPATAERGRPAQFSAAFSDFWGPVAVAVAFGDGATATGGSVSHAYERTGTYTATFAGTDAAGHATTVARQVAVRDTIAPVLGRPSLKRRRFRAGKGRTALSARRKRRTPAGTAFRFDLSEDATVRIRIERRLPGRRVGRKCRKQTRSNARRKRCTRSVGAGTLTRRLATGRREVAFSGRLGRRALRPGLYRATLTARDGSGNGSRAARLAFRVVPR